MTKSATSSQICTRCVMDTSDPGIRFDSLGVCNHCHEFDARVQAWNLETLISSDQLTKTFAEIREAGKGQDFDCIMGLSGGVDSSYVAYLAKQHGLRPLCVHLDNGWNSELAVANIHNIVSKCGYELFTHVLDWEEFRDLQRSFFKADVVDLELLTDHAIFGVILQLAKKHGLKYILSGANIATEQVMPKAWVHRKQDITNIRAIHKEFGHVPLKSFPQVSTLSHVFNMYGLGYKVVKPLDMIAFDKAKAKATLISEFGWRDYGGKHYESAFTKFYQAHILPKKFGIDKRRAHLSTLILSGQMTRDQALRELSQPLYDEGQLKTDFEYVCKKLGFTEEELKQYLQAKPRPHREFASDQWVYDFLSFGKKWLDRLKGRSATQ